MGRIYTVPYAGTPAAAAVPWVITAGSGRGLRLLGFNLESEAGETDQQIAIVISTLTGSFTAGTGGTTPTPAKADTDDPAADFAVRINGTAPTAGTGAKDTVFRTAQPLRAVVFADPPITVLAAQAISVEVGETAGSACVGTAVIEEM